MKNKLRIVLLLALCCTGSVRAQVAEHYFALWGEGGASLMLCDNQQVTTLIGTGGGIGLGYELNYNRFIMQLGVHANSALERLAIADAEYTFPGFMDSERFTYTLLCHQQQRKDNYTRVSLQTPLLFGGEFNHMYFLVGAKFNLHVYTVTNTSALYSASGIYEGMIDVFEHMPNHQFFTAHELTCQEKYRFNYDVLVSGELGLNWNLQQIRYTKPKIRLALYADYGLLDSHLPGDNKIIDFGYMTTAKDLKTCIRTHNYLSTNEAKTAIHHLQFGLKLTFLFGGKTHENHVCRFCPDYAPFR